MSYKNEILDDVGKDLYRATKILSDINHNFASVEVGNYCNIIRACNDILCNVAEDLYQLRDKEVSDETI